MDDDVLVRALSLEALKTADSWMKTANLMIEKRIYNTALYAEEMSVEIGLKAIMLALGEDPPKVHNILESVTELVNKSEKITKGEATGRTDHSSWTGYQPWQHFNVILGRPRQSKIWTPGGYIWD